MQRFPWLFLCALLVVADPSRAVVFETFYLDPTRSNVEFVSGEISGQLTSNQFLFANLDPQAGSAPVPVSGSFVAAIDGTLAAPLSLNFVPGSTEVHIGDGNLLAPGVGGTAGTTAAAFGASFFDPSLGIGGDFALHDLIFALDAFQLFEPNGSGGTRFFGDLAWLLAAGQIEMLTTAGIGGSAFVPFTASASGFTFRFQTDYTEVSPGVFEMLMPFEFTSFLSPAQGPFNNVSIQATFSGQLLATNIIPEPGTGLLLAAGLLGLAVRRRGEGSR